jgi:uncharacterized membrane protein
VPFEGFLHPALAWGAALAAVPLLIHLLNRQRHRPQPWAAMRFVLAAYRRTRRRAQLENLLLLLLRMAAVALLALAIARPFLSSESPLAALTERRRDLVLVLDDSASTAYRESVASVHESILERARTLLAGLDGTRGDRARLIVAAARPRTIATRDPAEAATLLETLGPPADEPLDLAAALSALADLVEDDASGTDPQALEVRLLTDLQKHAFQPPSSLPIGAQGVSEEDASLGEALDRLESLGLVVWVEDLGPPERLPPNLSIASVAPASPVLGAGAPTEIAVRVANHGAEGRAFVRVAVDVDGVRSPSQTVDVPARETVDLAFPVTFREAGAHVVAGFLEGDRLTVDDSRATIVDVPPPVRVLLVDGDPRPDVEDDELGYLRSILEPVDDGSVGAGRGFVPFATSVVNASAFAAEERDLAEFDVIVLANVPALPRDTLERVAARTAAGGALLLTLGDSLSDPAAIDAANARLWNADGSGLLPGRLLRKVEVASRRTDYFRPATFDEEHPALRFFADERWKPYFTEVPVYGFVASDVDPGSRVLASLDDPAASPLLSERTYDRGRVLLWTSSADNDWNRIPESPSTFVPLFHELLRYAGRGSPPTRDLDVGSVPVVEVDAFPRQVALVRPDATRTPIDGEPVQVGTARFRLPPLPPLDRAGVWRIEWDEGSTSFAAGLDPRESDLERLTPSELESRHTVFATSLTAAERGADDEPAAHGELWRGLAALSLLALVAETLWSAWISRGRRRA